MVEPRTPEREVGVRYLPPLCCFLVLPEITVNTQEAVAPSRQD